MITIDRVAPKGGPIRIDERRADAGRHQCRVEGDGPFEIVEGGLIPHRISLCRPDLHDSSSLVGRRCSGIEPDRGSEVGNRLLRGTESGLNCRSHEKEITTFRRQANSLI